MPADGPLSSHDLRFVVADRLGYVFAPFYSFHLGQRLTRAQRGEADKLYLDDRLVGYALPTGEVEMRPLDNAYLDTLYRVLLLAGTIAVVLSLLVGWLVTRPMLGRLRRLGVAVRRWRPDGEADEVPVRGHDEIALLTGQFNRMSGELADQYKALQESHAMIADQARTLHELSHTDDLTGLHNRRYLDQQFPRMLASSQRTGQPLALVIMDVDHFKDVNDTFSHDVGDQVLRRLAALLRGNVRNEDVLARVGGEEMVVLMPGTACDEAERIAERIRRQIGADPWHQLAPGLRVTASFGIAASGSTRQEMLRRADRELYRAKSEGRNRVCVAAG